MKRLVPLMTLAAVALAFVSCTDYIKGKDPQLEIKANGDWLFLDYGNAKEVAEGKDCPEDFIRQGNNFCCPIGMKLGPADMCYEYREFSPQLVGESKQSMEFTISNAGEKNLVIENIYMQEDECNAAMTLSWKSGYPSPEDFPLTIEPDLDLPKMIFDVVFEPDQGNVDISHCIMIIKSNHPDFENKKFDKEYKLLLTVEQIGPKMTVDKSQITYGCVTGCSYMPVKIDNIGTDTLTISKIQFESPSSEFNLSNPPALPLDISKAGDPDYNSLTFDVEYCPGDEFWEDNNTLQIVTNDPTIPGSTMSIEVSVMQSPSILKFSTDSPFGYLDYSSESTHSVNIYNTPASECDHMCDDTGNCCGCSIQLKSVVFDPPDSDLWYTYIVKDPTNEDAVLSLPRALKGGASAQFEVNYQKPAGHPEDRNATMCIKYVSPMTGPQDYCTSMIAQSQCQFAVAPVNQVLHFNSASPTEEKEKAAIIINNGAAPCTISHVSVTDQWGSSSDDYNLKDIIAGNTEVPAFALLPIWITYSPHSTTNLSGKLTIEYIDDLIGSVEDTIILQGAKEDDCMVPIADPGDSYDGYSTGDTVTLDGCGSTSGSCGGAIFDNGYIWFLTAKPTDSTASLNTEGGCMTQFVPDIAGDYTVSLIVYDQENFYQSDFSTATITVGK